MLVEQRLATDEIPVIEDQGPPHVGFPRGDALVHVVAVQVHAGFQTQGIPGAQADGRNTRVQQLPPQCDGIIAGQHDFHAVFPGIAGAGNHPLAIFGKPEHFQGIDGLGAGTAEQPGHQAAGLGALDGKHGQVGPLADIHGKSARVFFHPRQVGLAGGAIYHQTVVIVPLVGDQVIDDAAAVIEHGTVQGTARGDAVHVVGQQVAQKVPRTGPGNIHHRHMGDVEYAGVLAHRVVLLDLGAIVDRHVPAAKVDHLAAGRQVRVVQSCAMTHINTTIQMRGNYIGPRPGGIGWRHGQGRIGRMSDLIRREKAAAPAGHSRRPLPQSSTGLKCGSSHSPAGTAVT